MSLAYPTNGDATQMDFFPVNSLDPRPDLREFLVRWYVSHLLAMEEKPLSSPATDQPDVYRLLFLPTFRPPAVVRLPIDSGAWHAVYKRSDGRGGYESGRLVSETRRTLSPKQAAEFSRLLEQAGFWEMPSSEDSAGCDGSRAVLEGVRSGRYHVVDRWSPHGTPYARLVEFLLDQGSV